MLYLSLKALHVVAAIFWVGSLGLICFVTRSVRMDAEQIRVATRVTDAAIGITWLAGIVLVVMGGWYLATWWYIKTGLVVFISAIHTFLHRRWRRAGVSGAQTHELIAPLLLVLTMIVVLLVVLKLPL